MTQQDNNIFSISVGTARINPQFYHPKIMPEMPTVTVSRFSEGFFNLTFPDFFSGTANEVWREHQK